MDTVETRSLHVGDVVRAPGCGMPWRTVADVEPVAYGQPDLCVVRWAERDDRWGEGNTASEGKLWEVLTARDDVRTGELPTTCPRCHGPIVRDEDGDWCPCTTCELCGAPDPLYDAHGWYCQECRDQDPGEVPDGMRRCDGCGRIEDAGTYPDQDGQGRSACCADGAHLDALTTLTAYRLTCGHAAQVPGEHGATSGRAWCVTCGESVAVAHVLPAGAS